ncbi:MAG: PAS domain-containing sensor histidine kinase [Woeseiaceae bacterium]
MTASAINAEQLQSAFEVFNEHSTKLEHSYRELQDRVEVLTRELKEVRSARLRELIQKERVSHRLALLLETLPGAILVIDGSGIVQEQNSEALRLLNEPLNGCKWADIVKREANVRGTEDGNIQLRDGRWLSLARRPLKYEPGEILLLSDVTESRRMSDLRQRGERLTAIGKMTAEFAHQVRTPLASAMLFASHLDPKCAAQQRIVDKINQRLQDLGRMVNDMLGFASGGKRTDEFVDVRELLRDIRGTVCSQLGQRTRLQVFVDGASIDRKPAADATFTVAGNRDALKGALINLVMNADQATGGETDIQLGAWSDDETVFFTVTDNGPGIEDSVVPQLFEPFFTTRPQGTGLGLAVVRSVARAHGGDAFVDVLSQGTRFTIQLPQSSAERTVDDDD